MTNNDPYQLACDAAVIWPHLTSDGHRICSGIREAGTDAYVPASVPMYHELRNHASVWRHIVPSYLCPDITVSCFQWQYPGRRNYSYVCYRITVAGFFLVWTMIDMATYGPGPVPNTVWWH